MCSRSAERRSSGLHHGGTCAGWLRPRSSGPRQACRLASCTASRQDLRACVEVPPHLAAVAWLAVSGCVLCPPQFTLGLEDVRVYTFGSPRVGNDVFATFFDNEIKV